MRLVDLDKEDVVLTFTVGGKRVSYTRDELLEALGPPQEHPSSSGNMNQAQLGRALAWLLNDVRGGKAADVEGRLSRLLAQYNGLTSPHPSRIPHILSCIGDAVPATRGAVDAFLRTHSFRGRGPSPGSATRGK